MEKIELQKFRELKQEVIELVNKQVNDSENEEYEENEKNIARYKEIIEELSEYDLSDIDFEEWRGMYLYVDDDIPVDFSKTKANLDFSIITYIKGLAFPNFKSCQIKNFDFENLDYSPEMFDEEYREENKGHFLSEEIPEDVAKRFYEGNLTLTDIENNPELKNKIEEKNIEYGLREMYKILGREEFCKLDGTFIDASKFMWYDLLNSRPDLRTAKEIMPVLYKAARDKILGYFNSNTIMFSVFFNQEQLGNIFKEQNPDLFLSDDVPNEIKEAYYGHMLSFKQFSENLQYFKGKKVAQAINGFGGERQLIQMYGEGIYDLLREYKPLMDKLIDGYAFINLDVPSGPIEEDVRKEIMRSTILAYFNNVDYIESLSMLKLITDFVPIEMLPFYNEKAEIIFGKYDIDKLIEVDLDIRYLTALGGHITNLEEIKRLDGVIEEEDLKILMNPKDFKIFQKYGIDSLLEFGVKDLRELSKETNDLYKVRKLMNERPIELINMGKYSKIKLDFIKRYGIDNIIRLDEQSNGMFSHEIWGDDIYLTILSNTDSFLPKIEENRKLTFEEFKERMYKILLHAKSEEGSLKNEYNPDYDFIQGEFREEHPDIFIDGDIAPEVKTKFYRCKMSAEDVRQNPELIQLLKGKDLSTIFSKKMTDGIVMGAMDKDGNIVSGGIPNIVNMAQYFSEKLGQEEFLKICADYGKCLDNIGLSIHDESMLNNIRENIEDQIYKGIKSRGIKYFEELPEAFRQKHPELFLPKNIDEKLRQKFYDGNLSFEDIRQNPQLKDVLLSKDMKVGFGFIKKEQRVYTLGLSNKTNELWYRLDNPEILYLAEKYGLYLNGINPEIFEQKHELEKLEDEIRKDIEKNILSRRSPLYEKVPEFFRTKHPEMFLGKKAPEELKRAFYDRKSDDAEYYIDGINFQLINKHPEWKEFLKGKELRRAFSIEYEELFRRFDSNTLLKLGVKNPETIEKMVQNHKESTLETWYKSTGGKFIPHHIVMLNFPEEKIDNFLRNSKKWSALMRIDNYNISDDGKAAILKAAYSMGVFEGNDEGFNKTIQLFTDIPQELTEDQYKEVMDEIDFEWEDRQGDNDWKRDLLKDSYTKNEDGRYVLRIDKQKEKQKVKMIRSLLEEKNMSGILTPLKAHALFDSFAMEYNPDFVRFFSENIQKILLNPEDMKDMAAIQRQFDDIVRTNAGRKLTLEVAQDYIKSIAYENIEIGNEAVAQQAKIAGYSQKDFEIIQRLYNEGETREFSSIPRIQGETKRYTYEMLRLDDPLALTIGTLTDCCQEIHGAGESSMEHSVVSPDGRVFVVKDIKGRIVAQSWFWRNAYTGCFDNIEIPHRIFGLYEAEHPGVGRKELAKEVLEVYKKAAEDLMREDKIVYDELLQNGTITKEQYDSLLLGKVTIGLGYNDIADAIKEDQTIHEETEEVRVKGTQRIPHPYTDAYTQYAIAERKEIKKSNEENLYVHQDSIPVYDGTNMESSVLLTMKRMEQEVGRYNLAYLNERSDEKDMPKSQRIINSIAREYGFDASDTKVLATARIAIIYSKNEEGIKIGDVLSSPIKKGLNEEEENKAKSHIMHQLKKALKQIAGSGGAKFNISLLPQEQQQEIEEIIKEIEKESSKRGER